MDEPGLNQNAENIFPGQDQENTQDLCTDDVSNDCDYEVDCNDSDCAQFCQPTPTPTPGVTPTPSGEPVDTPTPDPCGGDECCGRGTHTECSEPYCEPSVEVCSDIDQYDNIPPVCETQPGECEPEQCVEVCN